MQRAQKITGQSDMARWKRKGYCHELVESNGKPETENFSNEKRCLYIASKYKIKNLNVWCCMGCLFAGADIDDEVPIESINLASI